MSQTPAAWHPDPTGRYGQRYWDGAQWTGHVASGGQQHFDLHGLPAGWQADETGATRYWDGSAWREDAVPAPPPPPPPAPSGPLSAPGGATFYSTPSDPGPAFTTPPAGAAPAAKATPSSGPPGAPAGKGGFDVRRLSMGHRIMGGAAVALIIDLVLLPWHHVELSVITVNRSGVEAPNGWVGVLALLLSAAIVGRLAMGELRRVPLPDLPVSWPQADLIAAGATGGFVLLKLVMETSYLSVGAYLAVILSGVMVYGAVLLRKQPSPSRESYA